MLRWIVVAGLLACAGAALPGAARATVVDRIVHVVGDRVITASDLAFERELSPLDTPPVGVLAWPAYDPEQRLIDYAVLRDLAGDSTLFRPQDRDVRARVDVIRGRWPSPQAWSAFLARWGIDEMSLQGTMSSRMVVERYVARNAPGARDASAEDAWAAYRAWMHALRARVVIRSPS